MEHYDVVSGKMPKALLSRNSQVSYETYTIFSKDQPNACLEIFVVPNGKRLQIDFEAFQKWYHNIKDTVQHLNPYYVRAMGAEHQMGGAL